MPLAAVSIYISCRGVSSGGATDSTTTQWHSLLMVRCHCSVKKNRETVLFCSVVVLVWCAVPPHVGFYSLVSLRMFSCGDTCAPDCRSFIVLQSTVGKVNQHTELQPWQVSQLSFRSAWLNVGSAFAIQARCEAMARFHGGSSAPAVHRLHIPRSAPPQPPTVPGPAARVPPASPHPTLPPQTLTTQPHRPPPHRHNIMQ